MLCNPPCAPAIILTVAVRIIVNRFCVSEAYYKGAVLHFKPEFTVFLPGFIKGSNQLIAVIIQIYRTPIRDFRLISLAGEFIQDFSRQLNLVLTGFNNKAYPLFFAEYSRAVRCVRIVIATLEGIDIFLHKTPSLFACIIHHNQEIFNVRKRIFCLRLKCLY